MLGMTYMARAMYADIKYEDFSKILYHPYVKSVFKKKEFVTIKEIEERTVKVLTDKEKKDLLIKEVF
jgi:hypothetical protein